jgi:hydrogenase/urease accessory protein HupE
VLSSSGSIAAHDLGISSINLEILDGKLVAYSSYARGDFGELITPDNSEKFKKMAKEAIVIEVDGKQYDVLESSALLDNADGLNLRHLFGEVSGSKVKITSLIPLQLSDNHLQILKLIRHDREISRQFLTGDKNEFVFNLEQLHTPNSFGQFFSLGIKHIILGFDHLVFLLAMLLVVTRLREIAGIITFFTIAHSITLSLAVLNIITIPSSVVEPVIALSIIYVGLENLFKTEQKKRWLVAYVFGLVHGLGFAAVLREIGIGSGEAIVAPLLSFNFGVEVGQIAFALLILPFIWKLRKTTAYESGIVPIVSLFISIAGVYWLIERLFY